MTSELAKLRNRALSFCSSVDESGNQDNLTALGSVLNENDLHSAAVCLTSPQKFSPGSSKKRRRKHNFTSGNTGEPNFPLALQDDSLFETGIQDTSLIFTQPVVKQSTKLQTKPLAAVQSSKSIAGKAVKRPATTKAIFEANRLIREQPVILPKFEGKPVDNVDEYWAMLRERKDKRKLMAYSQNKGGSGVNVSTQCAKANQSNGDPNLSGEPSLHIKQARSVAGISTPGLAMDSNDSFQSPTKQSKRFRQFVEKLKGRMTANSQAKEQNTTGNGGQSARHLLRCHLQEEITKKQMLQLARRMVTERRKKSGRLDESKIELISANSEKLHSHEDDESNLSALNCDIGLKSTIEIVGIPEGDTREDTNISSNEASTQDDSHVPSIHSRIDMVTSWLTRYDRDRIVTENSLVNETTANRPNILRVNSSDDDDSQMPYTAEMDDMADDNTVEPREAPSDDDLVSLADSDTQSSCERSDEDSQGGIAEPAEMKEELVEYMRSSASSKFNVQDFIDDQAELSGSEAASADEDPQGAVDDDVMDIIDLIEEDIAPDEKEMNAKAKFHMMYELRRDEERVNALKDKYLRSAEPQRKKTFRWRRKSISSADDDDASWDHASLDDISDSSDSEIDVTGISQNEMGAAKILFLSDCVGPKVCFESSIDRLLNQNRLNAPDDCNQSRDRTEVYEGQRAQFLAALNKDLKQLSKIHISKADNSCDPTLHIDENANDGFSSKRKQLWEDSVFKHL